MNESNIDDQNILINPNRPRLRYIDLQIRPNCFKLSKRYTLAILIHIGFLIIFAMRSNLCFFNDAVLKKIHPNVTTAYDKAIYMHMEMDAMFLLAYILVQIPAAIISYKYPSQRVFGICILASSIMAIFEAFTLDWSNFEFGFVAFFQGLVQSTTIPAVHGILFTWAPSSERATLSTIAYSGTFTGVLFGTFFSHLACGYFEEEHLMAVYGTAGIIWFLVWIWLVFERPQDHPTIDDSEFEYLKLHIQVPKTKPPIPWKKIFSSLPCWAIFVVYICRSFNSYYLFQADYTQYNYVFKPAGSLAYEVPALVMAIFVPASGYLADQISSRTSLSITNIRKYYICGGLFIEIIAYLPSLYMKEESWPYLFDIKIFDMICYSFTISGYFVNHLDIAPMYACVIIAVGNCFGALLPAFLLDGTGKKPFGNEAFFIVMAIIHSFGVVFYGIWGSGEIQPWAKTNEDENDQNSTTIRNNGIENPLSN